MVTRAIFSTQLFRNQCNTTFYNVKSYARPHHYNNLPISTRVGSQRTSCQMVQPGSQHRLIQYAREA